MTKLSPTFRGPSLILLATVHILLFAAGLIAAAALRHGASYITPFASGEALRSFLAQSPMAVRVTNFFLFGSAVPFGIFAVTVAQPTACSGCPRCRDEHCPPRRPDRHQRAIPFRHRGLDLVLARCIGLCATREGARFSQLPVRRSLLRRRIRSSGGRSVRHKLLYAASSAVAGGLRHVHCDDRRTLLVESYRLPGKLFHPNYPVSGLHLDDFCRSGTGPKSQRGQRCAHSRFCSDSRLCHLRGW